MPLPSAGTYILILKIAVVAVTLLLIASLLALRVGAARWHGRINIVVFVLTVVALLGLELVAQVIQPDVFDAHITEHNAWPAMYAHLGFAIPSALLLPVMLFTGLKRRQPFHYRLGWVFSVLWVGTFVTGVFFLPH